MSFKTEMLLSGAALIAMYAGTFLLAWHVT